MTFESCEFVGSYYKLEQLPQDAAAEIALFGRSNVGKSSMINSLAGKKIARVSKTPGKTQSLNYYLVDQTFWLVDVPGYGFAKSGPKLRTAWRRMVDEWCFQHRVPKSIIHLIDGSLAPQSSDMQLREWLGRTGIVTITVAGKIDRVRPSQRARHLDLLKKTFGDIVLYSSVSGEGQLALIKRIYQTVQKA